MNGKSDKPKLKCKMQYIKNYKSLQGENTQNFVPTYFAWLTPEKQKKKAKELETITNHANIYH